MISSLDGVGIGSFACTFGDLECRPDDIAGFAELWRAQSPDTDFETMGCGTFRKMTGPVEGYVVDCVKRVLGDQGVPAEDVDHVVFATSDACLGRLGRDFAVGVLAALGMTGGVPVVLSFQQCCSSLGALRYGWELFADEDVRNVVLVSLDFTPDDPDRVRSFALFGDAVAGCLISRTGEGRLRLVSSALGVDYSGLVGRDSFVSRQKVAQASFAKVFGESGEPLESVTKVFPTNLYQPLTLFNAMAAGVPKSQLHFAEPMYAYGHCGNSDWMINLVDYADRNGLRQGELYLAQASAPGFFACGLLKGT
jgi:3-oxoacyl-[acyl-carrier-protein] synthase-3